LRELVGRDCRLCIADIARAEQHLAAEIGRVYGVEVDEA
jgi:hypothetical protein